MRDYKAAGGESAARQRGTARTGPRKNAGLTAPAMTNDRVPARLEHASSFKGFCYGLQKMENSSGVIEMTWDDDR